MHHEEDTRRRWERSRLKCGCLLQWCKKNKGTILVCSAVLLATGLAVHRRLAVRKEQTPPAQCSFHSSISEEAAMSVLPEQNRPGDTIKGSQNIASIQQADMVPRQGKILEEEGGQPKEESSQQLVEQSTTSTPNSISKSITQKQKPFISNQDLTSLKYCLESEGSRGWKLVQEQELPAMEYKLFERTPEMGGPDQYLSTTRYKYYGNPTKIRDFMTDNNYKLQNDPILKTLEVLDVDPDTGIEVYHCVKEYPYIGRRDYVLATKIWESEADKTYYCVIKAWPNHPKAPPKHKIESTRIENYLSGWKISKARKGGSEVKGFHQEDMESILVNKFKKYLVGQYEDYVKKLEKKLQEYIKNNIQPKGGPSAVTFATKI